MQTLAREGYTQEEVIAALHAASREIKFSYDVLDETNAKIGELSRVESGSIGNNSLAKNVRRTGKFKMGETSDINFLSDRIRPMFQLRMIDRIVTPVDVGSRPYEEIILDKSPVGYWRLGDSAGVTAKAKVGPDGSYLGGVTLGATGAILADVDTAVVFDGSSGRVSVPYDPLLNPPVFSWECWARCDGGAGTYRSPMTSRNSDGPKGFMFYADNQDRWAAWIGNGSTGWVAAAGPTVELGEIVHLVGTYDGTTVRLYLDGALAASALSDYAPNDLNELWIGAGNDLGNQFYFPGLVDEPAVYDYVLSPSEVQNNYKAGLAQIRIIESAVSIEGRWISWPLGIFLPITPSRTMTRTGQVRDVEAYDQLLVLLDDKVEDRYVVDSGINYVTAVNDLLSSAGIVDYSIISTDKTLPASRDWAPGTEKLRIVNDLLTAINYAPLYFNAEGRAISRQYQSPSERGHGYEYAADEQSILAPELLSELDLFGVPNKWIVTVSEANRPPLTATYTNVEPNSPTSTVSRGRTIVDFRKVDAADQESLDEHVKRIAFEASQVYEIVEIETALMPHHENDEIVRVTYPAANLGAKYSEHTWKLPLKAGARMKHKLRRVVSI